MLRQLKNGISLRVLQIYMIAVTVIMSGIMIFYTVGMMRTFRRLADATEEHILLEKAAHELMDASDYLTERVQRFTVDGERHFLDEYFQEAFEENRREEAIAKMNINERTSAAVAQIREAMDKSVQLMDLEYYAMRLVIEAKEYTGYPELLDSVSLNADDAALAPEDKMKRASETVLSNEYYDLKDKIRTDIRECLEEIDKLTYNSENREMDALHRELFTVRAVIVIQILSIVFMVLLTAYLGIRPVLKAVDRIKEDQPIPEVGANEFRYLAQAYNKMYATYRSSLARLSFKASHDELTGAYNRAGYDLLLSSIDLKTTYMMLFDVDNFKSINDTYGHETGDKALIKLVDVLHSVFRDDDCICRVGGDEFVVFMVHSGRMQRRLIESKIGQISEELENTEDGLPPISISVGIVHGSQVTDVSKLFEKTDEAMYESKKKGKNTYTYLSN